MRLLMLSKAKIRTKLLFALVVLASITAVTGYIASKSLSEIRTQFGELTTVSNPELVALLQIQNASSDIETNLAEFSVSQGDTSRETGGQAADIKYQLLASLEALRSAQDNYTRLSKQHSNTINNEGLTDIIGQVETQASDLASAREQKASPAKLAQLGEILNSSIEQLKKTVNHNIDVEIYQLGQENTATNDHVAHLIRENFVLVVGAMTLALVVGLLVRRWIVVPLAKLKDGVAAISRGELNKWIDITSSDEIGELAAGFNVMEKKLQESYYALESEKAGVERKVVERTKQLREEQARLRASIEGLNLGFVITDNQDNIIIKNHALTKIFEDKSAATTIAEIGSGLSEFNLLASTQNARTEKHLVDAKEVSYGAKILRIFLAPIIVKDNDQSEVLGTVLLVEDITESKVQERSKDEFFSIASHELRTPLTSIKGNSTMIMQYFADALKDPALKEMVNDIHGSSVRLIEIVNDFLDLSRLEQGKMTFKPSEFRLEKIIESVIYEMKTILQEKNLYLKFDKMTLDALPAVWADQDKVKQVVYNLVGNATKFTEQGGITISADAHQNMVRVSIADTGRGIPLESQKLLFHKFQQAGNSLLTRDTTRGTGLGLFISKMLVENMDGNLVLEHSDEGKGSTFSFTLPAANERSKELGSAVVSQKTDTQTGLSTNQ